MKKKLSFLFVLVTALILQTKAQADLIIRTNLTDLLVSRYSIGAEVIFQKKISLAFDVDYVSRNVFIGSNHPWYPGGDTHKQGIIIEPQAKWYLEKRKKAYVSISGFFGNARYSRLDERSWGVSPPEWTARGFSLHLGLQQSIKRLLLDIYLGTTWAQNKDMGIFYEDRALFPQPNGLRISGGLRFGLNTCQGRVQKNREKLLDI